MDVSSHSANSASSSTSQSSDIGADNNNSSTSSEQFSSSSPASGSTPIESIANSQTTEEQLGAYRNPVETDEKASSASGALHGVADNTIAAATDGFGALGKDCLILLVVTPTKPSHALKLQTPNNLP